MIVIQLFYSCFIFVLYEPPVFEQGQHTSVHKQGQHTSVHKHELSPADWGKCGAFARARPLEQRRLLNAVSGA